MITVEQMLSIGRDCGLNTVYEAWSQVQSHWDVFFEHDKFAEQQTVLNYEMFEKGLLELNEDGKTENQTDQEPHQRSEGAEAHTRRTRPS